MIRARKRRMTAKDYRVRDQMKAIEEMISKAIRSFVGKPFSSEMHGLMVDSITKTLEVMVGPEYEVTSARVEGDMIFADIRVSRPIQPIIIDVE